MQLSYSIVQVPWRSPLRSAHADTPPRKPRALIQLRLQADDGVIGHGEAAPLPDYDGVSLVETLSAITQYAEALVHVDGADPLATLAACRAVNPLPQALAAIDLALWDQAGRRLGRPVWELLGASDPPALEINAVIGAEAPEAALGEARAAAAAGYRTLKVKVGAGNDAGRVAAVRVAVGPGVAIRIDANGAWQTPERALAALAVLAPLGIEFCEEPVHGAAAIAEVSAASSIPIAVDESVGPEVLSARIARLVCLKIGSAGTLAGAGITGVIDDARRARQAGYEVYLASTLDGPLGIAAALHAAAVIRPDRACGLSTLDRFAPAPPFTVTAGQLRPPAGPGLGDGLLDWYAST